MAAFIRLDPDRVDIAPGLKVLSAEDYAMHQAANDVLTAARQKARDIESAAQEAYDAERQRGYAEGQERAREEQAEQMFTTISRAVDYLASAEKDVAKTVMLCLQKILGDTPDEALVIKTASHALSMLNTEKRATLVVHPTVHQAIQSRIGELLEANGQIDFLEVIADPTLLTSGCRLETDLGVIDASVDQQINALAKALGLAAVN